MSVTMSRLRPMHPFLCAARGTFFDEITDAAVPRLLSVGVAGLSIGPIAADVDMTRQGLTHHLKQSARDRRLQQSPQATLHEIVIGRFGDSWLRHMLAGLLFPGSDGARHLWVPADRDEREGVVVWNLLRALAWTREAAGDPVGARALAGVLEEQREETRRALERWVGRWLTDDELTLTLAVADGIQLAASDPMDPLPADAARRILDGQLSALIRSAEPAS